MNHGMTMTTTNATTLTGYQVLQDAVSQTLRAMNLASQDGTMADWLNAKELANASGRVLDAEKDRIRATGWGENGELELPVQGYLSRRHTDPCIVRYSDLH
jgi:hypothetical protein